MAIERKAWRRMDHRYDTRWKVHLVTANVGGGAGVAAAAAATRLAP